MVNEALILMRNFHGKTQTEVAKKLLVTPASLQNMEKFKSKPSLRVIKDYSDMFGIRVSDIFSLQECLDDPEEVPSTAKVAKILSWNEEVRGE